ncbi:hypothetical protein NKY45_27285 [Sinorhizobium meliloti]|uniref:hypothetical protein n=1 Tax=Rhizobium meliloti TaxID=382 RepID=UPI003D646250
MADINQWQLPRNEASKLLGWSNDGRGMVNKGIGEDIQAHSDNLDTLSGITPGAAGQAILADALQADVRDYLDVPAYVAARAALKALDTTKDGVAFLSESGREGIFKWTAGNFSTQIAADTQEGIHIKADEIASTAGAWVRQFDGDIFPEWFGATGDGTTSDQTAAAAAVASAVSSGDNVYWTNTYVTTASIASLHSVRHFGPGLIKRGSDLFPVQPKNTDSNTIYFSASGSSANDGLSSSEPRTFQAALDALENYGPVLNGSWTLKGAAGTYTNAAVTLPDVATSGLKVLKVQGPAVSVTAGASVCIIINNITGTFQAAETITGATSGFTATVTAVTARKLVVTMVSGTPTIGETVSGGTSGAFARVDAAQAVPTLILDGTSSTGAGIKAYGRQWVEFKDIKVKGYTSRGINAFGDCLISLKNVHDEDNLYGVFVEGFGARLYVSGGVWEKSASYAPGVTNVRIQSFFGVKHHIGYSYDETTGNATQDPSIATAPQLICAGSAAGTRGLSAAENATGHAFLRATDMFKGVEVQSSARVHLDDNSVLHRNSYGIEWRHGCDCSVDSDVDFGAGTANENTSENVRILSGAVDSNATHAFALGTYMVGSILSTTSHTGTVAETQIGGTLYTLSGDHFKTTGSLRMRVYGTMTGTAGTKILRMRVGGNAIASVTFVAGATSSFVVELSVMVTGNDAQFGAGWGIAGVAGASAGICDATTGALAQTWGDGTDRAVTLHATLGNIADTIEVNAIELWRVG